MSLEDCELVLEVQGAEEGVRERAGGERAWGLTPGLVPALPLGSAWLPP